MGKITGTVEMGLVLVQDMDGFALRFPCSSHPDITERSSLDAAALEP